MTDPVSVNNSSGKYKDLWQEETKVAESMYGRLSSCLGMKVGRTMAGFVQDWITLFKPADNGKSLYDRVTKAPLADLERVLKGHSDIFFHWSSINTALNSKITNLEGQLKAKGKELPVKLDVLKSEEGMKSLKEDFSSFNHFLTRSRGLGSEGLKAILEARIAYIEELDKALSEQEVIQPVRVEEPAIPTEEAVDLVPDDLFALQDNVKLPTHRPFLKPAPKEKSPSKSQKKRSSHLPKSQVKKSDALTPEERTFLDGLIEKNKSEKVTHVPSKTTPLRVRVKKESPGMSVEEFAAQLRPLREEPIRKQEAVVPNRVVASQPEAREQTVIEQVSQPPIEMKEVVQNRVVALSSVVREQAVAEILDISRHVPADKLFITPLFNKVVSLLGTLMKQVVINNSDPIVKRCLSGVLAQFASNSLSAQTKEELSSIVQITRKAPLAIRASLLTGLMSSLNRPSFREELSVRAGEEISSEALRITTHQLPEVFSLLKALVQYGNRALPGTSVSLTVLSNLINSVVSLPSNSRAALFQAMETGSLLRNDLVRFLEVGAPQNQEGDLYIPLEHIAIALENSNGQAIAQALVNNPNASFLRIMTSPGVFVETARIEPRIVAPESVSQINVRNLIVQSVIGRFLNTTVLGLQEGGGIPDGSLVGFTPPKKLAEGFLANQLGRNIGGTFVPRTSAQALAKSSFEIESEEASLKEEALDLVSEDLSTLQDNAVLPTHRPFLKPAPKEKSPSKSQKKRSSHLPKSQVKKSDALTPEERTFLDGLIEKNKSEKVTHVPSKTTPLRVRVKKESPGMSVEEFAAQLRPLREEPIRKQEAVVPNRVVASQPEAREQTVIEQVSQPPIEMKEVVQNRVVALSSVVREQAVAEILDISRHVPADKLFITPLFNKVVSLLGTLMKQVVINNSDPIVKRCLSGVLAQFASNSLSAQTKEELSSIVQITRKAPLAIRASLLTGLMSSLNRPSFREELSVRAGEEISSEALRITTHQLPEVFSLLKALVQYGNRALPGTSVSLTVLSNLINSVVSLPSNSRAALFQAMETGSLLRNDLVRFLEVGAPQNQEGDLYIPLEHIAIALENSNGQAIAQALVNNPNASFLRIMTSPGVFVETARIEPRIVAPESVSQINVRNLIVQSVIGRFLNTTVLGLQEGGGIPDGSLVGFTPPKKPAEGFLANLLGLDVGGAFVPRTSEPALAKSSFEIEPEEASLKEYMQGLKDGFNRLGRESNLDIKQMGLTAFTLAAKNLETLYKNSIDKIERSADQKMLPEVKGKLVKLLEEEWTLVSTYQTELSDKLRALTTLSMDKQGKIAEDKQAELNKVGEKLGLVTAEKSRLETELQTRRSWGQYFGWSK